MMITSAIFIFAVMHASFHFIDADAAAISKIDYHDDTTLLRAAAGAGSCLR